MQRFIVLFLGFVFIVSGNLKAEEGLWLFNAAPKKLIQEQYGFDLTDSWLEHVQLSSVRLNNGGSGSFVSPQGLVLTNHHVAAGPIQNLSTPGNDLLEKGFHAKSFAEELPCKGMELNVLISIEDVTEQVQGAIRGKSGEEAEMSRREIIAKIEKDSLDQTGLRSDVMSLYQGGAYHLYRYKKYVDVRLVFAPEQSIASFGGDPDNYEYPRYSLDFSFFRVYEEGKPAKTEHYLKWNNEGPGDGELIFVSGHPGRTNRAFTMEHLQFQRDHALPWMMEKLYRREVVLRAFASRSEENRRRADRDIDSVSNYRKRYLGQLLGMQTPLPLILHEKKEAALRKAKPETFAQIAVAVKECERLHVLYDLLETGSAFNCRTWQIAKSIARYGQEIDKPGGERLPEYRDSVLESFKHGLFSDAPIYEDLEILKLSDSLSMLVELYPEKKRYFLGKNPKELAVHLIQGSSVRDVAFRKKMIEGGAKAIAETEDPMIRFVLSIDEQARSIRKQYERKVEDPLRKGYTVLAEERFKLSGTQEYPDATFTLRLSYGKVAGYTEDDGTVLAPWTTLGGLYDRADSHKMQFPFDLPQIWIDKKSQVEMSTPFNVVTTTDTVGGNSGSPMVNTNGEVVGLLFDGNIQSPARNFYYDEVQSRSISVHTAIIYEALKNVYGAKNLTEELDGK